MGRSASAGSIDFRCASARDLPTGYLPGLGALVGHLGVLDERGMPVAKRGEPAAELSA
jgi:hypothetical protein